MPDPKTCPKRSSVMAQGNCFVALGFDTNFALLNQQHRDDTLLKVLYYS